MFDTSSLPVWPLFASLLGFLTPWGLHLLMSGEDEDHLQSVLPLLAIVMAVIGYVTVGFALHFGGIGILIDHPDVSELVWEWTPLREGHTIWWGVLGWAGFAMRDAETPLAALLLLATLPQVVTTTLLALLICGQRPSPWGKTIFAVLSAFLLAPLVGNWMQAGGWLMHLGESMGAGAGYLDFGGASFLLLTGGMTFALILATRRDATSSQEFGNIPGWSALMVLAGGIGWLTASPLHLWQTTTPVQVALSSLLAATAGGFIALLYGWLAGNAPPVRWGGQGMIAGWVAALALVDLVNPWQALMVGAVAAWLLILADYAITSLLGWRDPGAIFSAIGLPAVWGLLAVGLFAPMPGQMKAQAIGVATIFLLGFFVTSIFMVMTGLLERTLTSRSSRERRPEEQAS